MKLCEFKPSANAADPDDILNKRVYYIASGSETQTRLCKYTDLGYVDLGYLDFWSSYVDHNGEIYYHNGAIVRVLSTTIHQPSPILPIMSGSIITSIACSGSGVLAVGNKHGELFIFDIDSNKNLYDLKTEGGGVSSLSWRSDNKFIAAGTFGGKLCVFDIKTGEMILQSKLCDHITKVSFNPKDSRLAVVCDHNGNVDYTKTIIFKGPLYDKSVALDYLKDYDYNGFQSFSWSNTGHGFAVNSINKVLIVRFDCDLGYYPEELPALDIFNEGCITSLKWSPDDQLLAIGGMEYKDDEPGKGLLGIFNMSNGKMTEIKTTHRTSITTIKWCSPEYEEYLTPLW